MKWIVWLLILFSPATLLADAPPAWKGNIPSFAKDEASWQKLLVTLRDHDMFSGALVASQRMLVLFPSLSAKEAAYQNFIELIDAGYPISVTDTFETGDIEPSTTATFASSYFLYKGIADQDRRMEKWANAYFDKAGRNSPKYLFYSALKSYAKRDFRTAENLLEKILNLKMDDSQRSFVAKVARTLARIHFEKKEYDKSLDIYRSFLLRLNRVTPTDWLEAAWNYYHQKKYPEAIGILYNLESPTQMNALTVEKYLLRALIYRELCDLENIEAVILSFEGRFARLVSAIRDGKSLGSLAELNGIELPENAAHYEDQRTLLALGNESKTVKSLESGSRQLATYLYKTSSQILRTRLRVHEDQALKVAADYLINLDESLRYLKFDATREIFSPDAVFKGTSPPLKLQTTVANATEMRWDQNNSFWRDERLQFTGMLTNKCSN